MIRGHGPRELIVVECQFHQSSVADGNVGFGKGPLQLIVIQVQMTKFDKLVPEVVRQGSGELVASQIQKHELSQPEICGDAARQLVRVQIEVIWNTQNRVVSKYVCIGTTT